jgi:hypothetical protein
VLELMAAAMDDERAQQEAVALENFIAVFGGGGGGGGGAANRALTLDGDAAAAHLPPSEAKPFDAEWFHRFCAYAPKTRRRRLRLLLPPAAAAAPAPAPLPAPPPAPPPAVGTRAPRPHAPTAVGNHLSEGGWELIRMTKHYVYKRDDQTFVLSSTPRTDNPRASLGQLKRLDRERAEKQI